MPSLNLPNHPTFVDESLLLSLTDANRRNRAVEGGALRARSPPFSYHNSLDLRVSISRELRKSPSYNLGIILSIDIAGTIGKGGKKRWVRGTACVSWTWNGLYKNPENHEALKTYLCHSYNAPKLHHLSQADPRWIVRLQGGEWRYSPRSLMSQFVVLHPLFSTSFTLSMLKTLFMDFLEVILHLNTHRWS